MKKNNIISSIVLLAFSGILYYSAAQFPSRKGMVAVLNPGFYPKFLAVVLGVLSIMLFVSTLLKETQETKKFWEGTNKRSLVLLGITLIMLILFPIGLKYLGFPIITFIFIFTLIFTLSMNTKHGLLMTLGVSVAATTVIYLVFKLFLRIPFPRGIFFG